MPQSSVTTWLEFAMQQMAAESYFQGITDLNDPLLVKPRLLSGNNPPGFASNNYTRFTDQLADRFLSTYKIIDQHANDESGFSATLIQKSEKKLGSDSIYCGFLRAPFGERTSATLGKSRDFVFKAITAQGPGFIGRVSNLNEVGVV